jgi:hypothetical protein
MPKKDLNQIAANIVALTTGAEQEPVKTPLRLRWVA